MLKTTIVAASVLALAGPAFAQGSAGAGTGGTATAPGMSATTLGTGGVSEGADGETSASLSSGGSAAAVDGDADSRTKLKENPNGMRADSRATAQDGGTFARSTTKTKIKHGEVSSTTRTMAHEPGGAPTKETTTSEAAQPE